MEGFPKSRVDIDKLSPEQIDGLIVHTPEQEAELRDVIKMILGRK